MGDFSKTKSENNVWIKTSLSSAANFRFQKEEPFREVEIRFLIGKQCSILLLFALVLCVQKLEKLHNGTFLANWANPTWFQKDSQFDCFIVTFRVLHVSILYIFLLFSPSLVPFIMLWGLKLFRNNNHIIVEKSWKCNNYSDHFNLTRKIQVNSLHCFYCFFFTIFSWQSKVTLSWHDPSRCEHELQLASIYALVLAHLTKCNAENYSLNLKPKHEGILFKTSVTSPALQLHLLFTSI